MDDLYLEIILDHFKHPLNVGTFPQTQQVLSCDESNVGCGDEFQVSLLFQAETGTVKDVKWQGQGCAISTAAMSILSEHIKGKTVAQIQQIQKSDVLDLLGLTEITPAREKCLLLGLKAITRALQKDEQ